MKTVAAAAAATATAAAIGLYLYRLRRRSEQLAPLSSAAVEWHASSSEDASPTEWLEAAASRLGLAIDSAAFAAALDETDPLRPHRAKFCIPRTTPTYLCGNSLGLMPRATSAAVGDELRKWASSGVEGHFTGALPWATCEEVIPALMADAVGAKDATLEVAAMNSLTVNIHLLMAAFYRPTAGRAAILMEAGAFPSDRCAMVSQIQHHGFDPAVELIEVQPDPSDGLLHAHVVCAAIEAHWERLACIMIGGVNYLTGQVLDMGAIAARVHALNAADASKHPQRPPVPLGLDLAHAVGNVPLSLHEWGVDFASWCTYKYLNAGAGCLAAIYVHERHADSAPTYPRLTGWWGVPISHRFKMAPGATLARGAAGFGCSNVNPLMAACLQQSLLALQAAGGVRATRRKSLLLTSYLELLLERRGLTEPCAGGGGGGGGGPRRCGVCVVTPADTTRRGCQLSLRVLAADGPSGQPPSMRALEQALREKGVSTDAREPDIVRVAPAPLYNSFADALACVEALRAALVELA